MLTKVVDDWSQYYEIQRYDYFNALQDRQLLGIMVVADFSHQSQYVNNQTHIEYPRQDKVTYWYGYPINNIEDHISKIIKEKSNLELEHNNLKLEVKRYKEEVEKQKSMLSKEIDLLKLEKNNVKKEISHLGEYKELEEKLRKAQETIDAFKDALAFNASFFSHLKEE